MQKDLLLPSLHCFCQCTALSPPCPIVPLKIAGFNQFLNFLKYVSDFGSKHMVAPACFPQLVCFLQVPLSGVAMEVWSCTCVHFHTLWRRGAGWRAAHLHLKQQALRAATLNRAGKSGWSPEHNRCGVKTPTSVTPNNRRRYDRALHTVEPSLWCWQPLNAFVIGSSGGKPGNTTELASTDHMPRSLVTCHCHSFYDPACHITEFKSNK